MDPIFDYHKLEKNQSSSQGEIALAPPLVMKDSPARRKIIKGSVQRLRERFEQDSKALQNIAEPSPSQKDLKRLKRTCLEPLKPAKNSPKNKSLRGKSSRRKAVLDASQLSIKDFLTGARVHTGVHGVILPNNAPDEPNLERENAS